MNEFAKRMTVGFVLALIVAGFIGYGGMKKKTIPLYAEEFDQQSICAGFFQDLKALYGDIPATTLAYDYYSRISFPLPVAPGAIVERPF